MKQAHAVVAAVVCTVVLSCSARADFVGAYVVNMGDLGAGADSWRVYLEFDHIYDRVVGVSGSVDHHVLEFVSTTPLIQNAGELGGLIAEDFPSITDAGGDSWVTIGQDTFVGNDTQFGPGFLGNDGVHSVIHGTYFSDPRSGYADVSPDAPPNGLTVLIAQFTLEGDFTFAGTIGWLDYGGFYESPFIASTGNLDELGSCCLDSSTCAFTVAPICDAIGGVFGGIGTTCPKQEVEVMIEEPGGDVFTHVVTVIGDCLIESAGPGPDCIPGPLVDPWTSPANGNMCQNFGVPGSPAIPADFFDPGSDPFTGSVCLMGVPLGPVDIGGFENVEFGAADTLVRRSADPFERCELPSADPRSVDLEIAALSLASVEPITVTSNGGQFESQWDVSVDLSEVHTDGDPGNDPPLGMLWATKSHCNGGTYTSVLSVSARFTFTRVDDPQQVRVLDTGLEGIPPVALDGTQVALPWVNEVDPGLAIVPSPFCTSFHPGITDANENPNCDCNANGIVDTCDIAEGVSLDCDVDGVPDECQDPPACPADLNGSCAVDFADLVAVLFAWGPCVAECPEDLDGDLEVGLADLETLLDAWGPCGR